MIRIESTMEDAKSANSTTATRKPMRACMLTYSFYESDARVQQYTSALVDRGDTVDVICLKREGLPSREVLNGVNVYRIQKRKRNEKGQLAYAFKILLFLFRSAVFITRKHLGQPYELMHIHNVPDFLIFAAFVPKLTRTPMILDIHDILPEFYASKFKSKRNSLVFKLMVIIEKVSTAFSDHVIIANHIWYERITSRSVQRDKCTPILNSPSPLFFSPHQKSRTDGKFIMMYPGTLNWHQGLDIAIRAFARVTDQMPEAEFHIYGEGPDKDSLKTLTKMLGLDGSVIFKEFVPTRQIVQLMAEADVGVVPKRASLFGNEAQSTKIMEFMALGIPVIAPDVKISTYYHDASRVKFFKAENDADLAQCMLLLWREPHIREQLSQNALAHARQNSWAVKSKGYLDLVDSLVPSPGYAHNRKVSQPGLQ
jgi:glycosyltransferase involved in cell wall biosynthesis